jgi:hypothetical protein
VRESQVQGTAISLRPSDPALYMDRGVSLMTLKQYPAAVLERRILLQLDDDLDAARSD